MCGFCGKTVSEGSPEEREKKRIKYMNVYAKSSNTSDISDE